MALGITERDNMNCKYLKQKLNRKIECKRTNKIINIKECINCPFREYKVIDNHKEIKNKSSKLVKLEKNRTSLFTNNKNKCMFCTSTYHLTWHEIYPGRNRQNSMKYKLCLRMCCNCHRKYQEDTEFNDYWYKKGQVIFEETYPELNFIDIFHKNYFK